MVIESVNLTKRFGHFTALQNVSFQADAGDSLALFGPNGAGKTTLLKILSTLMKPTAGSARILGFDAEKEAHQIRQHSSLITHETYLYEELTGFENVQFTLSLYDVRKSKDEIFSAFCQLGIGDVCFSRVKTLSKGMKRKTALVRVMLLPLHVLFLDEAFDGLDVQGEEVFSDFLRAFKSSGGTFVLATHRHSQGLSLCDRVLLLSGGKAVFEGKNHELEPHNVQEMLENHA